MPSAFKRVISVISVTWCTIRSVTHAGRATILHKLVVWKAASSTHTGVFDMIPFSVLSACNALDLVIGK